MDIISTRLKKAANENGFGMVSSIFLLTLLAMMGAAVLEVSSADTGATINDSNTHDAFYIAHGGMEWAKYQLSQGEKPETSGYKNFVKNMPKRGKFAVTADYTSKTVTVTGTYGNAKSTQTFQPVFAADCVEIADYTPFTYQSIALTKADFGFRSIKFKKKSGTQLAATYIPSPCDAIKKVTLDKVVVQGLNEAKGEVYALLEYEGTDYYNQKTDPTVGTKISYKEGDNLNVTVEDLLMHTFDELSMTCTPGQLPPSGSSYDVTFHFNDGSKFTKTFIL